MDKERSIDEERQSDGNNMSGIGTVYNDSLQLHIFEQNPEVRVSEP